MRRPFPAAARPFALAAALLAGLASAQAPLEPPLEDAVQGPEWTLATPQHWDGVARTGEKVPVQLRFAMPPVVSMTFPCDLAEPPSLKVVRLSRDGGSEEPLWLPLEPVADAPQCGDGRLTLHGGRRGQYRAVLQDLPASTYALSAFWFGGQVGEWLDTPEATLTIQ